MRGRAGATSGSNHPCRCPKWQIGREYQTQRRRAAVPRRTTQLGASSGRCRQGALRLVVRPAPFIDLLNSIEWTDRNKSSFALEMLTESRDPALLLDLRARALRSLIEMARWKSELSPCQSSDEQRDDPHRQHGAPNDLRAVTAATRQVVRTALRPVGIHQDRRASDRRDSPEDYFRLCGSVTASPPSTSVPPLSERARFSRHECEAAPGLRARSSEWRVRGEDLIVQREA
jgi:hypothetical protein